ncbi:MAG: amino acid dehydrogenase [Robiginitomaculum sp.]|nr:MAG: amino acid dehydrogenase [Robiginitomaculum sp.]
MKILVLGAGVIGVTTAYALGRAGHEVTVLDKADDVAQITSNANGAQLAYSYAEPFACPETLKKLPGYLLGKDPGISMKLTGDLGFYRWGLTFIRNCTRARETENLHAMLTLAAKSSAAMQQLARELPQGIMSQSPSGKLILTRTQDELNAYGALADIKENYGLPIQMLDKSACIDVEPALAHWQGDFCGGLYAKGDSVLEPIAFCKALQSVGVQKYAVTYKFNHDILRLQMNGGSVSGVVTDKGVFDCEAVVLCLGNDANAFLKSIQDKQNIYPMQGYSLTLPLGDHPPQTSITDPKNKFVFAKIGDKIRIAGLLDANLPDTEIAKRGQHLLETARKYWPGAANYDAEINLWSGRRPMTPSSLPIVRPGKIDGLYYNIGHGSLGLTLAAGCAELITDMIAEN